MPDQPSSPVDPQVVRFGLSRAIQMNSEEFRAKNPRIKLDLDLVEDEKLLPEPACLALYQIYLESLDRARQAQAGMVWVRYYPLKGQMVLEVKDDGETAVHDFDLKRLNECLQEFHGHVTAAPLSGKGTVLTAAVPL